MAKINVCDYCEIKLGEMACSNRYGGSYCSIGCADIAEMEEQSKEAPKSTDDIIANLARRVAELERRDEKHREVIEELSLEISNIDRLYVGVFGEVTGIKRDIETWAQEVESLKHDKEPKQITLDIDTLAKLIGGVRG